MLVCLVVALMPQSVRAEREDYDRDDDRPKHHKHHIRANELAGIGIGVAALIGVAGYLVVRRRNTV